VAIVVGCDVRTGRVDWHTKRETDEDDEGDESDEGNESDDGDEDTFEPLVLERMKLNASQGR
jgi:hypothetical protein